MLFNDCSVGQSVWATRPVVIIEKDLTIAAVFVGGIDRHGRKKSKFTWFITKILPLRKPQHTSNPIGNLTWQMKKAETPNALCFSFRVYKHQSPIYRRLVSKQKSSSTLVCCPRQPFIAASMQKRVVFNYSLTDLKSISMKIMYVASYAKRKENIFCWWKSEIKTIPIMRHTFEKLRPLYKYFVLS